MDQLSVKKEKYEKYETLVKVIAKYHCMLNYININPNDDKFVKYHNYEYFRNGNKVSPHKYIATAVEAMIGAIYKEEKKLEPKIELIRKWKELVDNS